MQKNTYNEKIVNKNGFTEENELDIGVYYKGKGKITNGKFTVIDLPKYANKTASDFEIQITPIYSTNMHQDERVYMDAANELNPNVYPLYPSEVRNNSFIVYGPNADFFWVATGKYKDINVMISNSLPKKKVSTFRDRLEEE